MKVTSFPLTPSRKYDMASTTTSTPLAGATTAAAAPPPSFEFAQNERVLCYHGPLIYEAKVLKVANVDETTSITGVTGPHYFVHYKGWKQT